MNKLELMKAFVTVCEVESFTEAARILNLPKASISMAIQRLENHIGARLLQRTTRKVTITQDGQIFFDRCKDLLSDVTDLENLFVQNENLKGRIRVDFPVTIARTVIIPRLAEFIEKHPDLEIELGSTDRKVDLVREGYDFVLRVGQLGDLGLIARKIGEYKMANCVSPGYIKKYGRPRRLEDLKNHYLVQYIPTLGAKPDGFEYFDGSKYVSLKMKSLIVVNSVDSYQQACCSDLGIIQVPRAGIKKFMESGELVQVLEKHVSEPMPVSLVYPHRRNMPMRVKVFMDWVETQMRGYLN